MPTIARIKGYRLYFVSFDGTEPMHVHVRKENWSAKVWLASLTFAWSDFAPHENSEILGIVRENRTLIEERWHEHFDR
jgi:hypothetical protein